MPPSTPLPGRRRHSWRASAAGGVAIVAVLLAAVGACGSDHPDADGDRAADPTTTSAPGAAGAGAVTATTGGSPVATSGGPGSSSVATTMPDMAPPSPAGTGATLGMPHGIAYPPGPALPGMPPIATGNVYGYANAGELSPAVAGVPTRVYVPNSQDRTVTVIDPATRKVVDQYPVGKLAQHVVPSWDLRRLYVNASDSDRLVPIDPVTGKPAGAPIPVDAPYNLYFTPDGRYAVVMAERRNRMDWYDPNTWQRVRSVDVPCKGVNHADWTPDGRWFLATCEFSGQLLQVDTATGNVVAVIDLPAPGSMPQDLRLSPDGTTFFVADMAADGLWMVDATTATVTGFLPTDVGAHGIYPSRDGNLLYVSNRGRHEGDGIGPSQPDQGSISVVDATQHRVVATWSIPGGGSPDMGGVSADGRELWLSGRYDACVYVFDTSNGALLAKIPVGKGPHGLALFPQPGRYSLGHTGNYR